MSASANTNTNTTPPDKKLLVWLDLETTGLDPDEGQILEIGIIVTDLELKEVRRRSWTLLHCREDVIGLMDDYVLEMHLKSGLLKRCWAKGNNPVDAADVRERTWAEVSRFLKEATRGAEPKNCYLAGSSIHFDRSWLEDHAPEVLVAVSHRMLDVSSYKVAFPGLLNQPDEPAHRVMEDLEYSIDQHRQMRQVVRVASFSPLDPGPEEEESLFGDLFKDENQGAMQ